MGCGSHAARKGCGRSFNVEVTFPLVAAKSQEPVRPPLLEPPAAPFAEPAARLVLPRFHALALPSAPLKAPARLSILWRLLLRHNRQRRQVPVAQLDRASASGAEGSVFESRRGRSRHVRYTRRISFREEWQGIDGRGILLPS